MPNALNDITFQHRRPRFQIREDPRRPLAELKVGVPVSRVAKWKTTAQIVAIGFLIAGPAGETVLPGTVMIGLVLLWVSAVLTIYTGWDYLKTGIQHMMDEG